MPGPYTITRVADVAQASTESIISGERGRTLDEPSRVQIFANRETTEILYNITLGGESLLQDGISAINATDGDAPSTRDDKIVDTFGIAGAELVIRAANSAAAAAREARVIIFVTPLDDVALQKAMGDLAG